MLLMHPLEFFGLDAVQVSRPYVGLRRLHRFEDAPEEVVGYVTRCTKRVLDLTPADDALVQHIFGVVPPIPSRPSVQQQARVPAGVQNVDVFVHEAVVSQGAVFAVLDLIQRREDWQRLGVLVQGVTSTSAHVYLDGTLSGRVAELLRSLSGLGGFVERFVYPRLKDVA